MEEIKILEEYMILIGNKLEKLRQNMDMNQSDITDEVEISRKTIHKKTLFIEQGFLLYYGF